MCVLITNASVLLHRHDYSIYSKCLRLNVHEHYKVIWGFFFISLSFLFHYLCLMQGATFSINTVKGVCGTHSPCIYITHHSGVDCWPIHRLCLGYRTWLALYCQSSGQWYCSCIWLEIIIIIVIKKKAKHKWGKLDLGRYVVTVLVGKLISAGKTASRLKPKALCPSSQWSNYRCVFQTKA